MFTEVVSVTQVSGGIAGNVIPDEAVASVNFRYAPDRLGRGRRTALHGWCDAFGELEIVANAPSAPVAVGNELLRRLAESGDLETAPKQAWTPVGGVRRGRGRRSQLRAGRPHPGPTRGEHVRADALVRCYAVLRSFACA